MDIRNVAQRAAQSTNVDRKGDRAQRAEAKLKDVLIPSVARDQAQISPKGRAKAATLEGLVARARDDGDRDAVVAAALQKLQSGELDGQAVLEATAQRVIAADFLSE
ncbi:MAG TPA: hypothetical protein VFZ65_11090 [Planctomycetota bacterium]|nr:hypothetical protein [Planctomycetota bacterium]